MVLLRLRLLPCDSKRFLRVCWAIPQINFEFSAALVQCHSVSEGAHDGIGSREGEASGDETD
jgi:hypothetical protein